MRNVTKSLYSGIVFLVVLIVWTAGKADASFLVLQIDLPGNCIPKFAVAMPVFGPSASIQRVDTLKHKNITATMKEIDQAVLPQGMTDTCGMNVTFGTTRVWAYEFSDTRTKRLLAPAHWPAATIQARRHVPTTVTYVNNLPSFNAGGLVQGLMTVDQTIHWADPYALACTPLDCTLAANLTNPCCQPYTQEPPAVTHLHGGEVSSLYDGGPDAWFTADLKKKGPAFSTDIYFYPNDQEGGTLWFHDHTLGATRTNVYSGLAGFYLLRDPDTEPEELPDGDYEIEMAIQNRHFDTNSQLFFEKRPDKADGQARASVCVLCHATNGVSILGKTALQIEDAISTVSAMSFLRSLTFAQIQAIASALAPQSVHPFFSNSNFNDDVTLVNGAPWPYLNVEPRRYRFHLLDGDNMIGYTLGFGSVPAFVIGADGSILDVPVDITNKTAVLFPGERYDMIVDFTNFAGQTVYLSNGAEKVVQFRISADVLPGNDSCNSTIEKFKEDADSDWSVKLADDSCNPGIGECKRLEPTVRLTDGQGNLAPGVKIDKVRRLVLNPGNSDVDFLLNNTHWDGTMSAGIKADFPDGISELPQQGSTEIWEIINRIGIHPIHTHLTQFQILNRQDANLSVLPVLSGYFASWDGQFPVATIFNPVCAGGVFCPEYGPPLDYNTPIADPNDPIQSAIGVNAIGGNPPIGSFLIGTPIAPHPEESGWKDTFQAYPGVTRIVIRWTPTYVPVMHNKSYAGKNLFPFDPTQGPGYAWHCHILNHEDNEMMRPVKVTERGFGYMVINGEDRFTGE
jgi:spore coat protein A